MVTSTNKKAAIYARVSTADQNETNQTVKLIEWAENLGYTIVATYVEQSSAWAGDQPALHRLLQDAQARQFQYLLVWALDRLSRKGAAEILILVHRFKRYNVQILSIQEPWTDAPGELTDLLYAIVGWVASMESKRRSERVKAGMDRARAQGKHVGRPKGSRKRGK